MRVDVIMPQMGESIAEGTITRWFKKVGDTIDRDEPLFEISTDKVDAEIPSPGSGTLVEIRNQEGETVPVNDVVGVIETEADKAAEAQPAAEPVKAEPAPAEAAASAPAPAPAAPAVPRQAPPPSGGGKFVSPVVRRIADEHGIDPALVPGTGAGGRVTKKDILGFVEQGGAAVAVAPPTATTAVAAASAAPPAPASTQPDAPTFSPGAATERVAMTQMRKIIAEHMVESRRTSAHVHSVFEVDMSRIVGLRAKYKGVFEERHGVKLTFTPFFVRAVCDGLRAWPIINASVEGTDILYKKDVISARCVPYVQSTTWGPRPNTNIAIRNNHHNLYVINIEPQFVNCVIIFNTPCRRCFWICKSN